MQLDLCEGVETSDIVQSCSETLTALSSTVRLQSPHESSQLCAPRLPYLHVGEGKVHGGKHSKLTTVGMLGCGQGRRRRRGCIVIRAFWSTQTHT